MPTAKPSSRSPFAPVGTQLFVVCPLCGMMRMHKGPGHFHRGAVKGRKFLQLRDAKGGRGSGFKAIEEASLGWTTEQEKFVGLVKELRDACNEILRGLGNG